MSLSVNTCLNETRQQMQEWRAKAELNLREKELLQDEQKRVLDAMQVSCWMPSLTSLVTSLLSLVR